MKEKILLTAVLMAGLMASMPGMSARYVIDKEGQHASVNFKASHLGFSYIIGRFNDFEGEFSHDPKNPGLSKVKVTINANSLDTNHAERDKHLRGEQFFDVDMYPTISFDSTGYSAGPDIDTLKGNLTIHGITRAVSIDVRHVGEGNDPWGGYRSGFEGNIKLNAIDYGLPEWVGEIEIELIIEGVRQKP